MRIVVFLAFLAIGMAMATVTFVLGGPGLLLSVLFTTTVATASGAVALAAFAAEETTSEAMDFASA